MKKSILTLLVSVMFFTSCSKDDEGSEPNAQALTTLTNSAEAAILFSGNANDSKNNLQLDGDTGGISAYSTDRKGTDKSAAEFNGNDNFLEYADLNTVLDNKKFTISVWVKNYSFPQLNQYQTIFKSSVIGSSLTLVENINNQIERLDSYFVKANQRPRTANAYTKINHLVFENRWRHIAITYSKQTDEAKIYVDGKLTETQNIGGDILPEANISFYIGGQANPGVSFNGAIDDFYLFNKTLTDEEIKLLANDK